MDHAAWDERYRSRDFVWGVEPNRFLAEEAIALPPGRALDLACGEGRNALWLAEQGWTVTGVDFSGVAVDRARSLASERGLGVEWVVADVVEWEPPPEAFDLAIILYLHLPPDRRRAVIGRARSGLAPGGTLLVVGHDSTNITDGYGGPQDPAVLYGPDDLVADLGGLAIERAERVTRQVSADGGDRTAIDVLVRARRGS
ncbi:MAG TPA: class I SAM-dependent methyltransferase [Acidimicrobiales bacterium]|nr:class I SAM-dependent methyltransferase [Acidimicrobiales bacterium]